MTKEDLSPEQLEAFNKEMVLSRGNIKTIFIQHFLFLAAISVANVTICNLFIPDKDIRFMVFFLSTLLVLSASKKALSEEADRFKTEANKILDN